MYGWSPRGVKGNPIMMTYLPLLNSYGGNFVNDDWTPGFAGPEGVGALSRLFSFIPYMPEGVAEYDTDQEVQLMLEGKCTALTEYTGTAQRVDDPASSKVVGKIDMAATPKQVKIRARRSAPSSPGSRRAPRIPKARCSSWNGSPRAKPSSSSPGSTAVRR